MRRPTSPLAVVLVVALVLGFLAPPAQARPARARTTASVTWSTTSPAVKVGTPVRVSGAVRGRFKAGRQVQLQQRLGGGWRTVSTARSDRRGRFALTVPTDWYHPAMGHRVVVKRSRKAKAWTSRPRAYAVAPAYAPAGSPGDYSLVDPPARWRWNPCTPPITYRVNLGQSPRRDYAAQLQEIQVVMARATQATGLRFRYVGTTTHLGIDDAGWPRGTNVVISWVTRAQYPEIGESYARGGPAGGTYARDSRGSVISASRGRILMNVDGRDQIPGFVEPRDADGNLVTAARGATLVHEMGHVLGLGHVYEHPGQVMSQDLPTGANWQRGDLEGLRVVGRSIGCIAPVRNGRAVTVAGPTPLP